MSAELVDPFDPTASWYPMQQQEYDDIRDSIQSAMWHDKALLLEALWHLYSALGTLAMTGTGPDNRFAAQSLRQVAQRAATGVPFYDPAQEVL